MKSPRFATPRLSVVGLPGGAATRMEIAVVGCGYVGLVTAACLASFGHQVSALDVDVAKIQSLRQGEVTIHEEGLQELVVEQLAAGRLRFTTEPGEALPHADIVFVAVGTPSRSDGSLDLSAADEVTAQLEAMVRAPTLVVLKSTVPVGTARRLQATLADACGLGDAVPQVLSNPEFLREGSAVADFMNPDRLIVGDDAPASPGRQRLLAAFAPLVTAGAAVIDMDTCSAELSKCAANAMLATRVSFMNEIAAIAAASGADIERVREGVGSDARIGPDFLQAGLGYGGSCLAKDVASLRETARRYKLRSDLLHAVERVNVRQHCWAFDALRRDLGGHKEIRGLRVTLWGLAFKPGTDDMRDAPSLALIDRLWRAGALLTLYDPVAMVRAQHLLGDRSRIEWAQGVDESLRKAEVLMLVTEWPQFRAFDPLGPGRAPCLRAVYDGRNALDAANWRRAGFRTVQIGRAARAERMPTPTPVKLQTLVAALDPPHGRHARQPAAPEGYRQSEHGT